MIETHLKRSVAVLKRAIADTEFIKIVQTISDVITTTYLQGGKLLIAGNGGSAADAQHIAGELVSRYRVDRLPLSAIALTTDTSVLTAIGNDYGYEQVFERQIRGLGQAGDVFVGISTSGRSPNVLAALKTARELGMTTVGFTGSGRGAEAMRPACDYLLAAPTDDTPLIQQVHIAVAHAICEAIERNLFSSPRDGGAPQSAGENAFQRTLF